MSNPPTISVPDNIKIDLPTVNFITIDGVVYPLGEGAKCDIAKDLKGYFATIVNEELTNLRTTIVRDSDEEFNKQVKRIKDIQRTLTSDIRLPSDMQNKLVFYHQAFKEFIIGRVINYSPTEIKGRVPEFETIADFDLMLNSADTPKDGRKNYYVNTKCPWTIPIVFGYSQRAQKIVVLNGIRTFHTLSDMTICTGTWKNALDMWNISDAAFSTEINRVNLFSLATGNISYNGTNYSIKSIIQDRANIRSITEEAAWKT